jgi:hypothetical protein
MEPIEPKFIKITTIPVVIHVGIGGKKSHLSQADVEKNVETGETCWIPYTSRCGSAKWSRHGGKSAETVMQHTGTAKITCKKCGEQEVTLNPHGFDLDHMRTYSEVYKEVKVKLMRDALPEDTRAKFDVINDIVLTFNKKGGSRPNIIVDGKRMFSYNSYTGRRGSSESIDVIVAIYAEKPVIAEVWNSEKKKFEKIEING